MKRLLLLLSLGLFFSLHLSAQTTQRALFLGNSYTYVNDLPALVRALALSAGDTLATEQNTPGGHTFQGHTTNPNSTYFLSQPGWDFLILQEQSQLPSFPQGQVQQEVYPYATRLDSHFHAHSACGQTIFYMTWGRKFGDSQNCQFWPPVCTYEGMQYELRRSYLNMAQQNQALVAPVGSAWWEAMRRDTTLELYSPDESHPELTGSYLAACVLYTTMYRSSPEGLPYRAGLDSATAAFLQNVAADVVLDSLPLWRIGLDDLQASFTWTLNGGLFTFVSHTTNADLVTWNFGNSDVALGDSGSYNYFDHGTYIVTMIAFNDCDTLYVSDTINVIVTGLADSQQPSFSISPQPSQGSFALSGTNPAAAPFRLTLSDLQGRVVWQKETQVPTGAFKLDLPCTHCTPGTYLLTITTPEFSQTLRVFQQ